MWPTDLLTKQSTIYIYTYKKDNSTGEINFKRNLPTYIIFDLLFAVVLIWTIGPISSSICTCGWWEFKFRNPYVLEDPGRREGGMGVASPSSTKFYISRRLQYDDFRGYRSCLHWRFISLYKSAGVLRDKRLQLSSILIM